MMSSILVIAEHRRGELRPVSLELIAAANELRGPGEQVVVGLIGKNASAFVGAVSNQGVDEIATVTAPVEDFDPDVSEEAVRALIAKYAPSLVLIPHSVDSYGYVAVLAAKDQLGLATDVYKIAREDGGWVATRGGYGQKVAVELDFPGRACVCLAVRSGSYKANETASSPTVTTVDVPALHARTTPIEYVEVSAGGDIDITTVPFIMSVGRGLGDEANLPRFKELAEQVGATLCCSRPIADSGWLPKSRQVGQSGKTASACKLYIAMGISGAIQHLAGMKHVETIIAVNTDPQASIFNVAKYGIVGDIFEVADALEAEFQ